MRHSDFRIRKLIGLLGLSLPIALPMLGGFDVISSMSHYYYLTNPSIFFIIVFSSLALFLMSYRGNSREFYGKGTIINDDWLTNLAGVCILIVVLIPTACGESGSDVIKEICDGDCELPLSGHNNNLKDNIHLISAAIFVVLMGYMSIFKFPRGEEKKSRRKLFRVLGSVVWLAVLILFIYFLSGISISNMVFWMETVALIPFGIAWLIKGETIEMMQSMFNSN